MRRNPPFQKRAIAIGLILLIGAGILVVIARPWRAGKAAPAAPVTEITLTDEESAPFKAIDEEAQKANDGFQAQRIGVLRLLLSQKKLDPQEWRLQAEPNQPLKLVKVAAPSPTATPAASPEKK